MYSVYTAHTVTYVIYAILRYTTQVRGLSTPLGASEEEALHIFFQGDTNRHVAEHALNKGLGGLEP